VLDVGCRVGSRYSLALDYLPYIPSARRCDEVCRLLLAVGVIGTRPLSSSD